MYRIRKSWEDAKSQIGAYENLNNAKQACPPGYIVFDDSGKSVFEGTINLEDGLQAFELNGMTETEKIKMIAPLYQKVMQKTGMLASVGLAQFCLESGYGTTDLAQNANNLHGMKCSLSGNTWPNSTWDGKSKYGKKSAEVYNGIYESVYSEFRSYSSCEDSIMDRAAYFIGAKNGSAYRYPNINKVEGSEEQVKLIKKGGYATDPDYVSKLINIILRYKLDQYNNVEVNIEDKYLQKESTISQVTDSVDDNEDEIYRVRKTWKTETTQKGAFRSLENAKALADKLSNRYGVFNSAGKEVYRSKNKRTCPYTVKVLCDHSIYVYSVPNMTTTPIQPLEPGVYTIVEEAEVTDYMEGYGKLKSGAGWISLDNVEII